MAQLQLKGSNIIYTLSPKEGLAVKEVFINPEAPSYEVVQIGSLSFRKSEIKIINLDDANEEDKEKWNKKIGEGNLAWKELNAKSPEYRAELNVKNYYPYWWYAYTGKWETKKDEEAEKIAVKFLKENPQRNVVDFNLWKKLMPVHQEPEKEMVKDLSKATLRILTSTMQSDMQMHKFVFIPEKVEDEINPKEINF